MVVHYPRTVWRNSYEEHEVTGKIIVKNLGIPYPSYKVELQSAVIAISWGSTAAPPSSWDKGCPDKHHRDYV